MHPCWLVRLFVAIVADTSDLSHLYAVDIQPGTREDKCAVPPVIHRATAHLLFIPCLPQIRAHSPGAGVPLERQRWWGDDLVLPRICAFGEQIQTCQQQCPIHLSENFLFVFFMHRAAAMWTEVQVFHPLRFVSKKE